MSDRAQSDLDPTPGARQVLRQFAICVGVAAALATVFTAWTPASLRPGELVEQLAAAADRAGSGAQSTAVGGGAAEIDQRLKVGIVAGHSGPNRETGLPDPGAVCADGLSELQVNTAIADLVVSGLQAAGVEADLLEEFDPRLTGYRAVALVSIHADACVPINDQATGFKVAAALDTSVPERAQRLVACLADRYALATDLAYRPGSITRDMTEYHSFYEIHSQTPAAIIETGFLYLDRDFLTSHPDRAARGIAEGVLCYINNEPATLPGEPDGP